MNGEPLFWKSLQSPQDARNVRLGGNPLQIFLNAELNGSGGLRAPSGMQGNR